jgi:hypothetical protein
MFNIMLGNSLSHLDSRQHRGWNKRAGKIIKGLLRALKEAMPDMDPQIIGDFVADVEDLWEYGQKLDEHFTVLFRMKFPKHSEHLRELLLQIDHEQCNESSAHIEGLKKSLPQLLKPWTANPTAPAEGRAAALPFRKRSKPLRFGRVPRG